MSCIKWPIKDCYVVENLQVIDFLLIFVGNMTIRKATQNDLDVVLSLIQCGREKMIASGNTGQWTEGYPPQTQLESDIEKGNCYLISTDDNRAIATFAFIKGVDPTYLKIEGEGWLNEEPYGTIHRVASAPGTRGIMAMVVDYCFKEVDNIRIDTHKDNIPMQRALERLGFRCCGVIHLANGDPRVAFQKKR